MYESPGSRMSGLLVSGCLDGEIPKNTPVN